MVDSEDMEPLHARDTVESDHDSKDMEPLNGTDTVELENNSWETGEWGKTRNNFRQFTIVQFCLFFSQYFYKAKFNTPRRAVG